MSARDLPLSDDETSLADILAQAAGPAARVDPQARVEPGVELGDGCVVRCGAVIGRGTRLGRDVRVGPNAVFVEAEAGERPTVVGDGAVIGANATVLAGLHIGAGARVLPGAVVCFPVPAGAIVAAPAAVIVGHTGRPAQPGGRAGLKANLGARAPSVRGLRQGPAA